MRVQTTRFLNGIDLEKKSKKLAELFDRIQRLPDNWIVIRVEASGLLLARCIIK
ncbi:hypothetical protein ACVWZR_001981 [Bradyrhizobium sp. i1.3.1]